MSGAADRLLRLKRHAVRWLDEALTLLFAPECPGCGKIASASGFCEECVRFPFIEGPLCLRCGRSLSTELAACGRCLSASSRLRAVRSGIWLSEPMRGALHRIKFGGAFELIDRFDAVWDRFEPFFDAAPVLVPVPLHSSRHWGRGFNQAERLATRMSRKLGLSIERHGLVKIRSTEAQSALSRAARLRNLRGSFAWQGRRKPPERVLLVDDVHTTGSTLEACARALWRSGCREIYGWTLFRVP